MATEMVPPSGGTGELLIPRWDEGHAKHEWDKSKPHEVESARKVFADYKAKGYAAYRIDPKSGDKGDVIKEFDPAAERIILTPPFAGG